MIKAPATCRAVYLLGFVLLAAGFFSYRVARAGQEAQQPQADQQSQTETPSQDQTQAKPKKKKSSFWGDLGGSVKGSKSEQTSETASAGTKGVGEGEKIGNVTPTAADRQAVTAMESSSVRAGDLSKFIEEGRLNPKH
jgi:hypothetical protein